MTYSRAVRQYAIHLGLFLAAIDGGTDVLDAAIGGRRVLQRENTHTILHVGQGKLGIFYVLL